MEWYWQNHLIFALREAAFVIGWNDPRAYGAVYFNASFRD